MNVKGPGSTNLAKAVHKNSKIVDKIMAEVQKEGTPPEEECVTKYEKERDDVVLEYAQKDKEDNVVKDQRGQPIVTPKDASVHAEKQKDVLKRHPEAEASIKAFNDQFNAYMAEEIEIPYKRIMESELPPNNISAQDISDLEFMLVIPREG